MSKTRSASSLNRLAISLACAVLVSTGAVAQTTGVKQGSSLEAEVTYDDQTLQSFAAAAASVLVLRRQYYPRIRAAEIGGSKDKADFLFKEMREHMHAAIRNSGFSSDQYRAISKAAKSDEILRGRINSILQGKPPALQRSQNVTRKAPPSILSIAVAGIMISNFGALSAGMGFVGLRAIPVVLIGGMDSIGGALVGGILVGMCEAVAGTYIEPLGLVGFKGVAPYLLLLIVLFIRPYGLFGTVRIERV